METESMRPLRLIKKSDGSIHTLEPWQAGRVGWGVLKTMAQTHDDPMVRIAAAERLIRLAHEVMPVIDGDVGNVLALLFSEAKAEAS